MRQTAPEDVILASLNLLLLTKPLCYRRRSGLRQTAPEDVILAIWYSVYEALSY